MCNDPRLQNDVKLHQALYLIGRNTSLRSELLQWLLQAEKRMDYPNGSIREDVTGPIIDAIHDENDEYQKKLHDGTVFSFLYRTKIARDFLLSGENPSHVWEPQTTRLLMHLAQQTDADTLIGGAYFGDQAILLAKSGMKCGQEVHCFEPNKNQAAMLARNAALNDLNNIRINTTGLWDSSDSRLRLDGFDSFANAVLDSASEDSFPTITIDNYVASLENRKLGLIMLDIEGAEYRALKGGETVIREQRPNIVFEIHRSYVDWTTGLASTPICAMLSDLGYTLYAVRDCNTHYEMGSSPIELVPMETVYLEGPPHGFNMLAVHDTSVLLDPQFSIVPNVSPKLLPHKDKLLHHPAGGFPPKE